MIAKREPLMAQSSARVRTGDTSTLVVWGMLSILYTVLSQFWAVAGIKDDNFYKYQVLNLALWLIAAYSSRRLPLRIPFPILVLLLLQMWYAFTTIAGNYLSGRNYIIVLPYYHVLLMALTYIHASCVVYIYPKARVIFARFFVPLTIISAFIGIGQIAGIGVFQLIGNRVMDFSDIGSFAQESGGTIRAIGMLGLGHGTNLYLAAVMMVGGWLCYRNLKWWEVLLIPVLLVATIIPQVRVLLPAILITALLLAIMLAKRLKGKSFPILTIAIGALGAFLWYGQGKLAYLFSLFSGESNTFLYRSEYLWSQARNVMESSPMLGIGIEPGFAGFPSLKDRWVGVGTMDGGFHFAAACGGLPGVTLLVIFAVSATIMSIMAAIKGSTDPWRRVYLLAVVPLAINLIPHMYMGNYIVNPTCSILYFVIAGLALASEDEYKEGLKARNQELYGSPRRFDAIAAKFPRQLLKQKPADD